MDSQYSTYLSPTTYLQTPSEVPIYLAALTIYSTKISFYEAYCILRILTRYSIPVYNPIVSH